MKSLFTFLFATLFLAIPPTELTFTYPLQNNSTIVTGFGDRYHPITREHRFHAGVDFRVPVGTKVFASDAGIVKFIGDKDSSGNTIIIKHDSGFETHYNHLLKPVQGLQAGLKVKSAEFIGYTGESGLTNASLLHFEIRKDGKAVNPQEYLSN